MIKTSTSSAAATILMALVCAGAAQANTQIVHAFDPAKHAVWIPGLDQRNLLLDPGATLDVQSSHWRLIGNLTSATDGSTYAIDVRFDHVLSGAQFGAHTGWDDGRIKGASWSQAAPDWYFARDVSGRFTALTGQYAGSSYSISRYAGKHDFWAQYGTCLNDKDCERGLSTWITFTNVDTGVAHRGDINISAAVPEPGAALVFGAGVLVVAGATRRRRP